jgi:predicted ATPase/DNA-binding SARP family transcriptional activator
VARAAAGQPELRLSVLGPLRLVVAGTPVDVPGPKRRAVLAMLAMASPDPISAEQLVDAVWPGEPPSSGRAALQSHVSRLRRHLGPAADHLTSGDAGYQLELGADELDALGFEDLVRRARSVAADDPLAARDLLLEARRLWRGPPLAELTEVTSLAAWARALSEAWIDASDLLVRCALEAGDPATAVAAARAAEAAEPLREATAVLLVRALAAHGRAAEALRAAHAFRVRLGEETGLEPSPALAAVERAVASGDGADPAGHDRAQPSPDGSAASEPPPPEPTSPLRTVPAPAAPLLGRAAELAGLTRLLDEERLVTVVGPAGVGKTHLALEAARQVADDVEAHLLRLAPVTDEGALASALVGVLGLEAGIGDPVARCALRLRAGRHLLVVDCCEHLLDAVRTLVGALVEACPELTVLATSRERLGLPGERTCRLAPLPRPDATSGDDVAEVASVALFLDRARRVRPDLELGDGDLATVARIVGALDGMPLAIELAAGRLSSLALDDLEARLDRALDLLGATGPDGRHRTLRAAVEWSYDLLPPDEQRLFRNLAVFPDGVDLRTAEDVFAQLGLSGEPATALGHLVDASMVEADLSGPARYRMLDTLRTFGLDRLEAEGESEVATERLMRWAVDLAAWLAAAGVSEDEVVADGRLRTELANLRTAWRTARSRGDLDAAIEIVLELYELVAWREVTEVWGWATELAADPDVAGHPGEAATLAVGAEAAWFSAGDLDRAEALAERAVAVMDPDDARSRRLAAWAMCDVLLFRGRYEESRHYALLSRTGTPMEAEGYVQVALGATYEGDLELAEASIVRAKALPSPPTLRGFIAYCEGELGGRTGEWARAEAAYRTAIETAIGTGAGFLEGVASVGLVSTLVAGGRTAEALAGYRALLDRWERTGGWTQQWTTLRNVADLLDDLGDVATAATLREAADHAPEAPALGPAAGGHVADGDPGDVDRGAVLDLARSAIDRALAELAPA